MPFKPTVEDIDSFLFNAVQDALEYYSEAASEGDDNQAHYQEFAQIAEWLLDGDKYSSMADAMQKFI
jgi:hypothetical protein